MSDEKKQCIRCQGELKFVYMDYNVRDAVDTGVDRKVMTEPLRSGNYTEYPSKSYACTNCGLIQEYVEW